MCGIGRGYPRSTYRLTAEAHAFAGRKGGRCLIEPLSTQDPPR
jgi:hypothetical protein